MYVIGLTGGVGSGKSYVAHRLSEMYDAELLIADELGHVVMKKGTKCHEKIVKLPWLRCPKCHGYKCRSCGECLCGFGFNRGEARNEEQDQP